MLRECFNLIVKTFERIILPRHQFFKLFKETLIKLRVYVPKVSVITHRKWGDKKRERLKKIVCMPSDRIN